MKTATATATVITPVKRSVGRPVTKVTLKRVVLSDGKPVGRGRPENEGKSERTVVFIPVDETFNLAKHGKGVKFAKGLRQFAFPIKRVDLAKFKTLTATSA